MRLRKKHIAAAVLAVALCLGCTGCKSEEAKNTESLINKIDKTITLESESGIEQAEEAYNALADKSEVSNSQKLEDARSEYDALYKKEVAPIESAISDIPEIAQIGSDSQAESKIGKARSMYDKASDEVKAAVPNYDTLVAAENAFADISVKAAVDAINQIGDVTLDSEAAIDAASKAYQAVPTARRADITNYDVLTAAQSSLTSLKQEAAKQAVQQAMSRLQIDKDSVENRTWYQPASYPKYINSRTFMLPYLGEKDGQVWMRLVFDYAGDDWIFMDQAIINIDGEVAATVSFDYGDVQRDTAFGAKLSEVADIAPTDSQIEMLRKVADSTTTTIRLKGDYQRDFEVPAKDKQGIKDILAVYDSMK